MSFLQLVAEDGETFEEVCTRHAVICPKSGCFYRVNRKENISANKELVLYQPASRSFITDMMDVRRRCGKENGAIVVMPSDVPIGYELYVQSTSSNRKLYGSVLIRDVSALAIPYVMAPVVGVRRNVADVAAPLPVERNIPKVRRVNNDHEEFQPGMEAIEEKEPANIIDWSWIATNSIDYDQIIDLKVKPLDEFWIDGECDAPTPIRFLQPVIDKMMNVLQQRINWNVINHKFLPAAPKLNAWDISQSKSKTVWGNNISFDTSTIRFAYLICDDAMVFFLEDLSTLLGVVVGTISGHPFIKSNQFISENSDGSSSDKKIPGDANNLGPGTLPNPDILLATMISRCWHHAHNTDH